MSNATTPSGVYYIDALLAEGGTDHWNTTIGTAATVSYSFLSTLPAAYAGAEESVGFAAFNSQQQSAARAALALWAEVANLTFTETTGSLGSIRFGTATLPSYAAAWAYYPGSGTGGDVWISNYYSSNATPSVGNYAFGTFLHEIGHALGLKHPGNYNADGSGAEGPFLPTAEDSTQYSLMSYNDHPTVTAVDPMTPMLYDIAAIQYLYGANTSTRSGNTTYSWSAGEVVLQALWDGGGTDTIDVSNQTAAEIINLQAGAFSSIAGQSNNVAIAYGAVIENAVGGSGNDSLTGNSAANRLDGGSGNDTLQGGNGDTLNGGTGNDWTILDNNGGAVTISGIEVLIGGSGADVVTLSGSSGSSLVLRDVETVIGSSGSDSMTLGGRGVTATMSGVESILGGSANDFVTCGDAGITATMTGVDVIRGGAGNDQVTLGGSGTSVLMVGVDALIGSAGGDFITLGNRGSTMVLRDIETLRGGAGTDVITLGNIGVTILTVNVETLIGGRAADRVTLGGLGSTMAVMNVDTIIGGGSVESLTVTGGSLWFQGGGGADVVVLQSGGGTDNIVLADSADGGAAGAATGYDMISNFQIGTDTLLLTGSLRTLVDDDANGSIAIQARASGTVNAGTDEAVILTGTVSSLADTDLSSFRTALGGLTNSGTNHDVLVLANDGSNTGVYLVDDADGDGSVAAGEVRLLIVFNNALLTASSIAAG